MESKAENMLRQNHLSVTDSRKKILRLILTKFEALSNVDIEHIASEKMPR